MNLFVTCSQGLEELLIQELAQLNILDVKEGFRGVYVNDVDFDAIYRINYCSRVAGRVLLPLLRFRCEDRRTLYRAISEIDWEPYLPKGKTFAIDANVTHRLLRNSLFAAQVAKDAICDQMRQKGYRPDIDVKNPDVQLNLYINNTLAVMSFDTSGRPLHKRGYRQETVEAPLQESLAAALLLLGKYQGDEVVCDPCCGSGTLLIEAALLATHTPPGYLRNDWGFMHLPEFSQTNWLKIKSEADSKRTPLAKNLIFGADINKAAVHSCKVNLRTAGFYHEIEVQNCDFKDYQPSVLPTFLVTNPPHGKRLDSVDSLRGLYRALGDFMKQRCAKPSKGFVFTGSLELAKEVGLAPKRRHVIVNGGVESRFLEFDLY